MKNSCFQIDAQILAQYSYPGEQFILRLQATEIATIAQAGNFVHIQCDPSLKLRRPLSIMRVDKFSGTIDILYKKVGLGSAMLAQKTKGQSVNVLGPIGKPFKASANKSKPLLIGGGVGLPPMVFLAETLNQLGLKPLVILGSEVPFPFKIEPSTIMVDSINEVGSMPLLNDLKIACRLASRQNFAGVFNGLVTDLAKRWLQTLNQDSLNQVEIFSCGPLPMLKAVHNLAVEFNIPCQVSLEEFMACGIGGCAACVVKVNADNQVAMKRVCVDGPVFDSYEVF